jgi:hypothetical protein
LADGRAGWLVRAVVAVVLGVFLIGASLLTIYALAALVPGLNRTVYTYTPRGRGLPNLTAVTNRGYPSDGLIVSVSLLAGATWLAAVAWLFFRRARNNALARPVVWTLVIAVVATVLGITADSSLRGEQEIVVVGIVLVAVAVAATIWLQALRTLGTGRALRNKQDNLPDLRCPECGYRMVGLTESRCPECGTGYTLDELVARQDFAAAQRKSAPSTVPPPPPLPTTSSGPSGFPAVT